MYSLQTQHIDGFWKLSHKNNRPVRHRFEMPIRIQLTFAKFVVVCGVSLGQTDKFDPLHSTKDKKRIKQQRKKKEGKSHQLIRSEQLVLMIERFRSRKQHKLIISTY